MLKNKTVITLIAILIPAFQIIVLFTNYYLNFIKSKKDIEYLKDEKNFKKFISKSKTTLIITSFSLLIMALSYGYYLFKHLDVRCPKCNDNFFYSKNRINPISSKCLSCGVKLKELNN